MYHCPKESIDYPRVATYNTKASAFLTFLIHKREASFYFVDYKIIVGKKTLRRIKWYNFYINHNSFGHSKVILRTYNKGFFANKGDQSNPLF